MSTLRLGIDPGRTYDLLDAIPSPVYVWRRTADGALRLVFANTEAHRESRNRIREIIGSEARELYADDPQILESLLGVLEDGTPRCVEHEYRLRSTGEPRQFRTSYRRHGTDEVVVQNDDLTERLRAEAQIEASAAAIAEGRARIAQLLERAPAIICTLRAPSHVYEMANAECRKLIGRDDIIGLPMADVLPEIAEQGMVAILDEVLATGEPFIGHAMPVPVRPAADAPAVERYLNVVIQPITEVDGTRSRTFAHCVDVTDLVIGAREQQRLEAQLRESQKLEAVGRLAGGVAHDFNNLLSAILGYADLALLDASESSTVRQEVEEIRKVAERAAQLTRQLLAFGRRQIRRPTRIGLDVAVRDASRLLSQLLGEQFELTLRAGTSGTVVHMDPGELDQILVNLVVNARDAMPQGGRVTIETSCCAENTSGGTATELAVLSVTDTGGGIDETTMPHIFEPFFTTKGDAGSGLGLSTVYGIVEEAGGHITVESTVGTGTCFRIHLPVAPLDDRTDAPPPPMPPLSPESATVLLAEDESGVRTVARRILERAGFRVLEARHGNDALRIWEQQGDEVDLLVTDLVMPEMGGRALAERLRETRADLPILFMSGYADDDSTRRGFSDLRVPFLSKPFTTESLVSAVRSALRQRA